MNNDHTFGVAHPAPWARRSRRVAGLVLGLVAMAGISVLAAPDAAAQTSGEVRVITAEDTDDDNATDPDFDERLETTVEMFLNGATTPAASITTMFTGIQPASNHDLLVTQPPLAVGTNVIVCQQRAAQQHVILAEVNGAAATLVADPAGSGRPCVDFVASASNTNLFFLNEDNIDVRVYTYSDTDRDGNHNATMDERVQVTGEFFINNISISHFTTSHVGIQDFSTIFNVIGTAGEGDVYTICTTEPDEHAILNGSATATDPGGLDRACKEATIGPGSMSNGFITVSFLYTPNIDIRVRTYSDTDRDGNQNATKDDRIPVIAELFISETESSPPISISDFMTVHTGIQDFATVFNKVGIAGEGNVVTICANDPAEHTGISSLATAADPDGQGRACQARTISESNMSATGAGKIDISFLYEPDIDIRVRTYIDTDRDGNHNATKDDRIPVIAELFISETESSPPISISDFMTVHTGIQDFATVFNKVGTAGEGNVVTICANDPAQHTGISSLATAADPDGQGRACQARTISESNMSATGAGKIDISFLYAPNIDVNIVTYADTNGSGNTNSTFDERIPTVAEYFINDVSTSVFITGFSGITDVSDFNTVGSLAADNGAAEGDTITICATDPDGHKSISPGATANDPDGEDRPCQAITVAAADMAAAKIDFSFLFAPTIDVHIVTVSDTDRNGAVLLSIDERVPADVEYFVNTVSVNELTTSFTGIHNSPALSDLIGTATQGDKISVCAADIADHATVSISLNATVDPDGLDRTCGAFTIDGSSVQIGNLDVVVEYLRDIDINVLTFSDTDGNRAPNPAADERIPTQVEYFRNGVSTTTLTSTFTGLESSGSTNDTVGTADEGDIALLCATSPAGYEPVGQATGVDPDGLGRHCISRKVVGSDLVAGHATAAFLFAAIADPPLLAATFTPSTVASGDTTTLTIAINNSANGVAAADLAFLATLPSGLTVANPANIANSCGSSVTATPGSDTLKLASGSVAALAACSIQVNVVAVGDGVLTFDTGAMGSSSGSSASATASLTVVLENTAPVAVSDNETTAQDTSVSVLALVNDSDADGDTLTITDAFAFSIGGSATFVAGTSLLYTPAAGFSGVETFTYEISDGIEQATAVITMAVIPANGAPVAVPDITSTGQDIAVTILALANDVDGDADPLTITQVSGFSNGGSASIVSGTSLLYTPAPNFNGVETFTYEISDGTTTAAALVTVTVAPSTELCEGLVVTINMATNGGLGTGTATADVILGTAGDDMIDGLGGDDVICGLAGDDVIDAGDGDDIVFSHEGDDTINGGDGNDTIVTGAGDDDVLGGTGNDIVRGNEGNDTIDGQEGNDRLLGGIDQDTLIGGVGDDYLGGFGGHDTINGGDGNDRVFGGFGADSIDGGPGNDIINGLIGDDIINGGTGADEIYGDAGNDTINGDGGNDILQGGNANDIVNGNNGNDTVSGGKADDTLSGGNGTDTCIGNLHINGDTADNTCEQKFGIP